MTITVTPANNVLGAFIGGVQVAHCSDDDLAAIKQAYVEHAVVFFRDQVLTPDQHIEFAQRWSEINVNRFFPAVDTHPTIAEVRKEPDQSSNIGSRFHTDHSYDQIPAMGSVLYAREVPPEGGDTIFASQYAAYDALSDGMKATLATMRAVHSSRHAFGVPAASYGSDQHYQNADAATQDAIHPVIIRHPLSGRPALYVNGDFTTHFDGWRRSESAPLLQQLFDHASRAEFTYRFSWEVGSLAIWDNRAVQHAAVNDYHGHRRLMHRITLEGEPIEAYTG